MEQVSSHAFKYQWYKNGNILTNDTSKIYSPTANGIYNVEITDSNGCKNISTNFLLGIKIVYNERLFFYPNPAKDIVNISSDINYITAEIIDITGRIIYSYFIPAGNSELNISFLPSGFYFLKSENILLGKFVKNND